MNTNRQIFSDNLTTTGTFLGRTPGVDLHYTSASFYRFAQSALYKLPPGYIGNTPIDNLIVTVLHILNIQIFKDDQPKSVDQFPAFLMSEVITPVFNPSMNVVKSFDGTASLRTSLSQRAYFALASLQILFVLLHPTLTLNRFAIAKRGKGSQAQINTNYLNGRWQWTRLSFTRKASKPVAQAIALDCQGLDSSLNRPMKFNFDIAYFGDGQPITPLKARLLEGETIIPAKALETGEAIVVSSLNPAKEPLKSQINPLLNILQDLRMNLTKFRVISFPAGQDLVGIVQCQALLLLLPRLLTQTKRRIVDLPTRFKGLIKAGALCFGWKHPEFIRLSHTGILRKTRSLPNRVNSMVKFIARTGWKPVGTGQLLERIGKPLYPLLKR
jgi:hypothetical protein